MENTDHLNLLNAISEFREKFGHLPDYAAFAPGRANLIGEHTDYNDGFVLPFALPYKTIIVASRSEKSTSTFHTIGGNFPPATFVINEFLSKGEPEWANYVKGTIVQYLPELPANFSLNAVIISNVPIGSGLSSSAALEVAIGTLLQGMCGITTVSNVQKALRCQKAEHTFADMPCGIMDQYISAMGSQGNLLLIDCRSTEYELVPFGAGADAPIILVTNSNVKHKLTGSEYPDRVRQCKEAVKVLQAKYPEVKALRDATMPMLDSVKAQLSDLIYRRAKHCITEDVRTLATVTALKNGDFKAAGHHMTQSHMSLQRDFEVSCVEQDLLVKIALEVPGVYGSRMTGGGFGGCTVTLVKRSAVEKLKQSLKEHYWKQAHLKCECYACEPSPGAAMIDLQPVLHKSATPLPAWIDYIVPGAVLLLSAALGAAFLMKKSYK